MIGRRSSGHREDGWLADLDGEGKLLVVTIRRWLDGLEAQGEVWNGFCGELGPVPARRLMRAVEGFLAAIAEAPRRPLRRHAARCPCLGADEARLAALVRAAARGHDGQARAVAAGIVETAAVGRVVEAAAVLGEALDTIAPAVPMRRQWPPAQRRWLH